MASVSSTLHNGSDQPSKSALRYALRQALAWDSLGLPAVILFVVYGLSILAFLTLVLSLSRLDLERPVSFPYIVVVPLVFWFVYFIPRAWLMYEINQVAHGKSAPSLIGLVNVLRRLPVVLLGIGLVAISIFLMLKLYSLASVRLCLLLCLVVPTMASAALLITALYMVEVLVLAGRKLWWAMIASIRHLLTHWRPMLVFGLIALPVHFAFGVWQPRLFTIEGYSRSLIIVIVNIIVLSFLEAAWHGLITRYTAYALLDGVPLTGQRLGHNWRLGRSLAAILVIGTVILAISFAPPLRMFSNSIGLAVLTEGDIEQAEEHYATAAIHFQRAVEAYRLGADPIGEAVAHSRLADAYVALGRYDDAVIHNCKALDLVEHSGDRRMFVILSANLSIVYRHQGRYADAQALYENALAEVRSWDDEALLSQLLVNRATVALLQSDYYGAYRDLEEALPLLRRLGDKLVVAQALNNLNMACIYLSQFSEAIKAAQEALAIYEHEQARDLVFEAATLGNLSLAYYCMGDLDRAEDYGEKALAFAREANDRDSEGRALSNLAIISFALGQYDQALLYNGQSLDIARRQDDRKELSIRLSGQAMLHLSKGQTTEAVTLLTQALDMAQAKGFLYGKAVALDGLGNVYLYEDRVEDAIANYRKALAAEQAIGDQLRKANTLANLGMAYLRAGQRVNALRELETAVAELENLRAGLHMPDLQTMFVADWHDIYGALVTLLVSEGNDVRAFEYCERARARTFLDQLANTHIDPIAGGDSALIQQEQDLRRQLQELELRLHEELTKPKDQFGEESVQSLAARLDTGRHQYTKLLQAIKLSNPEYASLVTIDPLTLPDTQRILTNTTLVEYFVLPEQTLAFVVTQNDFHVVQIIVAREKLIESIRGFWDFGLNPSLEGVPSTMQTLYQYLFAPIEPYIRTDLVVIAPHNVLHYVPFAALYDGEYYLIEKHTLFYIPSASVLPFTFEKCKSLVTAPLVLGDPEGDLSYSRKEAWAIAQLYGVLAHVGDDALERWVWEEGRKAGILHLSTHGKYNERSPLFSHVLLASDEEEDGQLNVYEIYNRGLNLENVDLVVLSACQTNVGEPSRGDEIVSLGRALIYAGAPSVVSSLWSVNDKSTGILMQRFYLCLQEGMSKASALRQVQIELIANEQYAHPYYWAAFGLMGDPGDQELP